MNQDRMSTPATVHQTRPNFFATEALRRAALADATVSRPARRTFAEMLPGATRQPVLHLAPNVRFLPTAAQDDSCVLCGTWACDGTNCQFGAHAPAPAGVSVKAAA
ncbi:hypothetical protein ACWEP8_37060 [Streptomyces hydrogenans]